MTLSVATERKLLRAGLSCARHVVVTVSAPEASTGRRRPPVNVAFVVDRSGSMAGAKLERAKEAVLRGLERLEERDRFAIVAYDNEVDVLSASTPASRSARSAASEMLRGLSVRGSTNLSEGWLTGCGEVAKNLASDAVGRVLLLTDGLANAGITEPPILARHAAELRARGVSTSTFGIGSDFDEGLLGNLADAGGGSFRFIDTAEKIVAYISSELGEALDVVARGVSLEVVLPEGAKLEIVGPWRVTLDGRMARIALPDLVSAQELEIVAKLTFPGQPDGSTASASFRVSDKENALGNAEVRLSWLAAGHAANDAEERSRTVDRIVAARHVARAREGALLANRDRRYDDAKALLAAVARNLAHYAGDDPELRDLLSVVRREADEYGHELDSMSRKERYFAASTAVRSKTMEGSSRKKP